jgi:hypothetical protein
MRVSSVAWPVWLTPTPLIDADQTRLTYLHIPNLDAYWALRTLYQVSTKLSEPEYDTAKITFPFKSHKASTRVSGSETRNARQSLIAELQTHIMNTCTIFYLSFVLRL